ncbi:DNA-processing protein DprA [Mesobacillus selenatarsenatis]|uniref:Rossmann fold nucleotide-binding protein Smf possibly involved in DNA uptake n=1 Tax=Mesobacillus selenatarsenatis (strain DSM 18680 / JCM 14380 / FERM P-15431 / SF-1) TaxID=1321606 RepID=A0A0A8X0I5_MESS1|nr:DNA-processing protein DprA [Mesobacillus selenatarsenatis]GAM12542.1 rossmann fold nucleotide-binding protein Smf possibly involved in DNA uptake [Mesobacillus selenatarsenatis SF-1]
MDELKKKLIQLVHSRYASWKAIYSILKANSAINNNEAANYSSINPRVERLNKDHQFISTDKLLNDYTTQNIHLITIFDEDYPDRLKTIYQPPWMLFARGNLSLLKNRESLAVVGSRNATAYGIGAIDYLFPSLIDNNVLIVSGLARGIDAHAHKAAIKLGGKTIGVIAGGFHNLYPKENVKLAEYMMEKQLVLSEYPPATMPAKWQFPMRNRIISGLSKGTLVVEARKKSGSLITADFALNEGRDVFAVPGSILSPDSDGVHYLIQQGAKLVKSSEDILEELGM